MPGTLPADVTTLTLAHAKGEQLKFWIDGANREAGTRVLTKGGRVQELRERLAVYYGLDLSAPLPSNAPPAGPSTREMDIHKRQWAHLRNLGAQWESSPETFALCRSTSNAAGESQTAHGALPAAHRSPLLFS